ncbi:putative DNA modification/repair radical SAM protein [Candidatus Micrarchaeota archaeon]|nr:putative DNA modification/repair radical SAM protein [Candidatus Micrarchaeota archaeon]MBU1930216.1 putative DNA modification/repair radical SAM protein [Candidatus Micrarchaeota archaeon]
MNTLQKLELLGGGTKWDICTPTSKAHAPKNNDSRIGAPYSAGVCRSFTPDGRCVSLLKVLNTNACIHDCKYCMHSTNSKPQTKTQFEPKELAGLFMQLYTRNYIEGLFLSSAVMGNADCAQEKMLETINIIRNQFHYDGYIHLKIMPGSNMNHIKQLVEISDRVSINLESPTKNSFSELISTKEYKIDILRRLRYIQHAKQKQFAPGGVTTQMVVGAAGETDLEYINRMEKLYDDYGVYRAYFSAFDPIKGSPLDQQKGIPLRRENFLYRTDWLVRFYGFEFSEIKKIPGENENLSLSIDPKLALALKTPNRFPVDINHSTEEELLHVPGIGPISAKRIIQKQYNNQKIKNEKELKKIGIRLKQALPFIAINGFSQSRLEAFS